VAADAERGADGRADGDRDRALQQDGAPQLRGVVALDLQRGEAGAALPDRGAERGGDGQGGRDQQQRRDLAERAQALAGAREALGGAFGGRAGLQARMPGERDLDGAPALCGSRWPQAHLQGAASAVRQRRR
jgi:hypothetical protein